MLQITRTNLMKIRYAITSVRVPSRDFTYLKSLKLRVIRKVTTIIAVIMIISMIISMMIIMIKVMIRIKCYLFESFKTKIPHKTKFTKSSKITFSGKSNS